MQALGYTLLFGSLGIAAALVMLTLMAVIRNGHSIDSVFYALPFG